MKRILLVMLVLVFSISLFAQVESSWRGPNRDGVYPGEKLKKSWPAAGPELIWSFEGLGKGFGSPAVTKDAVYITGMVDEKCYLFALNHSGKLLWKSPYDKGWGGNYPGSRTTPTVTKDKIYVVSAHGSVFCFDKKGKQVWSVDMVKTFGSRNIRWGITESILVDGNKLYCTPGGEEVLIAVLDRQTGKTLNKIKSQGEKTGYCSPVIVKHGNKRLLLTMTENTIVGIDPDTNKTLWAQTHKTSYNINPNTPIYSKGYVYAVSGYGTGGQMLKLSAAGDKVDQKWAQVKLDSQMGSAIIHNGYIYGSGHKNKKWCAINWEDGSVSFESRELGGKGNIIMADGLFYVYSEKGDVGLVKPNPQKFDVISSFKITKGSAQHWAHLVVKNGRLYVHHGEYLMVYNISR